MRLSRNNWLIRYAFFLTPKRYLPGSVSLCVLFWRCVFATVFVALALSLVATLVHQAYLFPWAFVSVVASAAAILLTIFLLAKASDQVKNRESLLGTAYWGIKNRFCPIIYIGDSEQD
jgi:hypothetical protein